MPEPIMPVSRGGENNFDNLVTSCFECNLGKLDVVLDKYKSDLIRARQ